MINTNIERYFPTLVSLLIPLFLSSDLKWPQNPSHLPHDLMIAGRIHVFIKDKAEIEDEDVALVFIKIHNGYREAHDRIMRSRDAYEPVC